MKVKIFGYSDISTLEKAVNEFIENVKVVDIKYASRETYSEILVVYEEKEE